jgi:hypothetical protein
VGRGDPDTADDRKSREDDRPGGAQARHTVPRIAQKRFAGEIDKLCHRHTSRQRSTSPVYHTLKEIGSFANQARHRPNVTGSIGSEVARP